MSPSQYLGPARKASGFGPSSPILGPTLRGRDVRRAPLPVVWPSQCAAGYYRGLRAIDRSDGGGAPRLGIPLSEEPFDSRVLGILKFRHGNLEVVWR